MTNILKETATIASGASLSSVIDLTQAETVALIMPSAWDAANITLQASDSPTGTFRDVYDDGALEVAIFAAASRAIAIDSAALKIAALPYIKLRSGTTGTPVNQTAARNIVVLKKVHR